MKPINARFSYHRHYQRDSLTQRIEKQFFLKNRSVFRHDRYDMTSLRRPIESAYFADVTNEGSSIAGCSRFRQDIRNTSYFYVFR